MYQRLHVHVSINVLHSSSTHWSRVFDFYSISWFRIDNPNYNNMVKPCMNNQNMPMAFNVMTSKHFHNSFVCFVWTQYSIYVSHPFMFNFAIYVLLCTVGYTLMSIFCFLFFNFNRWSNFDNHGLFMFLKPKRWSFHFTQWNFNMMLKLESNCIISNDDAYGFITCYVLLLRALAKKSPHVMSINLHVFTCLV
jgi:hypothetical protein